MVDALMAQNLTRTCGLMVCRRMMHRSWVGELGRPSIDFGRMSGRRGSHVFARARPAVFGGLAQPARRSPAVLDRDDRRLSFRPVNEK
jgi:hypothetical protein